jgi:hypothetical protein
MRGLPIAAPQTTLSLTDAEAPQPVYVLGGVVPPPTWRTAGEGQCSKSLPESQPANAYAERIGGLSDRAVRLWEHADMLDLTDRCF